jgi:tRNA A37 threonylcarbamoyladenosine dehydratase
MSDKDKRREDRLAAALRENLRKRKAQARDKAAPTVTPDGE